MDYRTADRAASGEFTEKKSRFIGSISPVRTEAEAVTFIQQVKNPYRFKVGDVVVNVAYTNGGATLNECFADMLSLL